MREALVNAIASFTIPRNKVVQESSPFSLHARGPLQNWFSSSIVVAVVEPIVIHKEHTRRHPSIDVETHVRGVGAAGHIFMSGFCCNSFSNSRIRSSHTPATHLDVATSIQVSCGSHLVSF